MGHLVCEAVTQAKDLITKVGVDPEFASSTIGQHYMDYGEDFWKQPVTEELIELLAGKETIWWRSQSGWAYIIGGGTPSCARAFVLKNVASELGVI
jgi:hypothetical protein